MSVEYVAGRQITVGNEALEGPVSAERAMDVVSSRPRRARSARAVGAAVARRVAIADLVTVLVVLLVVLLVGLPLGWSLLVFAVWGIALNRAQAYEPRRMAYRGVDPGAAVTAATWLVVIVAVANTLHPELPATHLMAEIGMLLVGTLAGRAAVAHWLRRQRRAGNQRIAVVVRGEEREVLDYLALTGRAQAPSFDVVGVQLIDARDGQHPRPKFAPCVLNIDPSLDVAEAGLLTGATAVVMVGPTHMSSADLRRTMWSGEEHRIDTVLLPSVHAIAAPAVSGTDSAEAHWAVYQGPSRRMRSAKWVMDRLGSALGLLVLSPLLLGVAAAIRLTDGGPALFRQTRVGRDGVPFTMFKFRTMVMNAEDLLADLESQNEHSGGTLFKIRQDPRITPVGRILRKFSIDELPQLINVLRGEMSLVGPRPPLPKEVEMYELDSQRRFAVRPGLTGLWQVSGRSDLDPAASAALDIQYVEHWSLGLDVRIVARTVKVVLNADGAY